ncbi:MAG: hypothetical protein ACF8OB_10660 [Phycisphaeraceae bacterium JB051]
MAVAYTFPFFSLLGALLGMVMLLFSFRRRHVGNERYCKKCRYQLQGLSDENTRCPECGSDIQSPQAITIGKWKTHWGFFFVGLFIAVMCLGNIGVYSFNKYANIKWIQYKPLFWLQASAIAEFDNKSDPNTTELSRRITSNELSRSQLQNLVETIINLHAKHPKWMDPGWQEIFGELLASRAFSKEQIQKLLQQSYQFSLKVRPVIRQGEATGYRFEQSMTRLSGAIRFYVIEEKQELSLNGQVLGSQQHKRRSQYGMSGINSSTNAMLRVPKNFTPLNQPLPLCKKITTIIEFTEPVAYPPFELTVTNLHDVTVVEKDAIIDTFIKDPSKQAQMQKAWIGTRVTQQDGNTKVLVHIDTPPIGLAMAAWIVDGEKQHRIGSFQCDALYTNKWIDVDRNRIPTLSPQVIVELRPDQGATRYLNQLGEFWGLVMQSQPITVNALYHPPFNRDLSFVEPLNQALSLDRVERTKVDEVLYFVMTRNLPLRINSIQTPLPNTKPKRYRTRLNIRSRQGNCGYGERTLIDPDAKTVDIIFMPNPLWETNGDLDDLPWGYPIVFRNVPIPEVGQKVRLKEEIKPEFLLDWDPKQQPNVAP